MSKQNTYTISIPKPCHEDWDKMTDTEKGKFCNACQKNVVDFTRLSEQEIIKLIEKSSTGICGRAYNNQLDKVMYIKNHRTNFPFKMQLFAGLITLATLQPVFTYASKPITQSTANFNTKENPFEDVKKKSLHDSTFTITGRVVDVNTKIPISSALVIQVGTSNKVMTNDFGEFEITISGNPILSVHKIGYNPYSITLTNEMISKKEPLEIFLQLFITLDIIISPTPVPTIGNVKIVKGNLTSREVLTDNNITIKNPSEAQLKLILNHNR